MKAITVDVNRPFRITIGNAREDSALQVNFDFAGWVEDYGSGSISLLVKRNGDSDPYPVLLDTEGTIATWDISNVDTDKVGVGEAQLIYTTDDVLKKSTVFTFDVVRALDDGTTPPDPYVTLIEQMTELATAAQDAADDAEDYRDAASGYASDAEGYKNDASGYATQASGYANDASGYANEAKGYRNDTSGYATQASGYATDAQGYKNDASGYASSASGYASDAQGYASDAQGYKNDASGYASQASGYASDASGYADSASGYADAASDSADDAQEYANSIGENLAPIYDEDESYDVGDYCFYDGSLYVCIAETTGEWDSDDWRSISMTQVFKDLAAVAVPTSVRQAIYTLLNSAAYATTGLGDEISAVEAWAEAVISLTISASTLSLTGSTPQYISATVVPSSATVTWTSSDNSVATVLDGIVTGVSNGSCVITASAGNLSANCSVTVSGFATLESISAVYTQSGTVYPTDSLDSLKADLVVTATYSDTSTATVPSNSYTLSGTLELGTSTITVTYHGKTTTFNVPVNGLYKLTSAFTSTGSNSIDTEVNYPESGTITIASEFVITSFPSSIVYAFGNKLTANSAYLALQNQLNAGDRYIWGMGISWTNGKNIANTNQTIRLVAVITFTNNGVNASITSHFKNVTSGTSNTYTNTYSAGSGNYSSEAIAIGHTGAGNGFSGTLNKFIIDGYEWDSTEIDNFLAGN